MGVITGMDALAVNMQTLLTKIDVNELLDGQGAAAEGEALNPLKKMIVTWGQGGFSLVQLAGAYIILIAIVVVGIMLIVKSNNPNSKAAVKEGIPAKIGGAFLIICAVGLFAFFQDIGLGIFKK